MILVSKQVSKPYFWQKEFYNDWEDITWITKVYCINYTERIQNTKEKKWSKIIKTTTTVIRLSLKYFLMSEMNTCIGEPKLDVLPLA